MADNSIRIEYNQDFKPLEQLLSGVRRAGDFFVSGMVEVPMPKLEVEGVGVLSFPVPSNQIVALIGKATRAPYGRGEATIIDESVRKVWQVSPDKIRVGGKSWLANFDGILKQVTAGLGCGGLAVSAELYKLLVYDQDGFFLAHRDTEKAAGMFGTLVVGLPSAHRGGELLIRHAGRQVAVDMSRAEISELSFAAFYADCEHEVQPITEGNRVCLIYNLIQGPGAKGKRQSMEAPDYEKQTAKAAILLEENLSAEGAPAKLAWLLEHHYSPDGLAFTALKSADAARVKVLAQAAERANCAAHLGIVHIEESGAAEPTYHSYRSRRRGWYRDDEEEESEDESSDDFAVVEVCDWRHFISQWRDLRDQPVEFGEIPLEAGELLPAGALDDEKPDEQRLMEASGNEGASFERSYHRAALVIWRLDRYAEVLLQAGASAALPYLNDRIEAAEAKDAPASARGEAVTLARRVVKAWEDATDHAGNMSPGLPEKRDGMLSLLHRLGDMALLEKFIMEVVTRDYDGSDNVALVASAKLLDVETIERLFSDLIGRHMRHGPGHCVDLLEALAAEDNAVANQQYREALRQIAKIAVNGLDEVGDEQDGDEWMEWQGKAKTRAVNAVLITKLLDVLGDLDVPPLRAAAAKRIAARPHVFDPVTILTPALASIRERDAAVDELWLHSVEFLLQRSRQPPAAPKDWRQNVKLECNCADCRELQFFALDPSEQAHRFRVRKDRRQHLHQQIEGHGLEMTHVTERQGSPQTLICTKDRRSYQRRCDQYKKDVATLKALAKQAHNLSSGNLNAQKRIETACSLASKWSPFDSKGVRRPRGLVGK